MRAIANRFWLTSALALFAAPMLPLRAAADLNLPDPDVTPPEVTIVQPPDGAAFAADGPPIAFLVDATDPAPESSGVAEVWIEIDGRLAASTESGPPWQLDLGVGVGEHTARAFARDWEGNVGESQPITIHVDAASSSTGSGSEGGSSTGTAQTGAVQTAGAGTDPTATPRGCACDATGAALHGWLLPWLVAMGRRRGRRARRA
jgi:hypothetical protein